MSLLELLEEADPRDSKQLLSQACVKCKVGRKTASKMFGVGKFTQKLKRRKLAKHKRGCKIPEGKIKAALRSNLKPSSIYSKKLGGVSKR